MSRIKRNLDINIVRPIIKHISTHNRFTSQAYREFTLKLFGFHSITFSLNISLEVGSILLLRKCTQKRLTLLQIAKRLLNL